MSKRPNIRVVSGKRGPRYQARICRDGKYQAQTFATEREAKDWLLQADAAMARGEYSPRDRSHSISLNEALQHYHDHYASKKKWPEIEQKRIKRLQQLPLAKKSLGELTGRDFMDYVRSREAAGRGGNTIRLELVIFSQVFKKARIEYQLSELANPLDLVEKPPVPKGRIRRFEDGELEQLCAALRPDAALMLRIAIETALRRTELLELEWKRVNLRDRYISEVLGKDGELENLPLTQEAVRLFQSIERVPGSDRVFHMSDDYISGCVSKAAKKLGMKRLSFHTSRHEATSRFFERGLRIDQVQVITRHKTLAMLQRYNHARMRDAREALDRSQWLPVPAKRWCD